MNKNDKQILDMLEKELRNSAENVKVPLRLQKESIVKMLENADKRETDFSDKTGTKAKTERDNIVMLRKTMAIAAMLAIVITGALVMRTGDGVKVVRADSFHEEYKSASPSPIENVESIEEIEKVIEEIREIQSESPTAEQTTQKQQSVGKEEVTAASVSTTQKADVASIIKGYSEYVAGVKQDVLDSTDAETVSTITKNEPEGVATYGDFKADIVKTDGEYLYIASTGSNAETGDTVEQIKIVKALNDGSMEAVSTIVLSESTSKNNFDECIEIYLKNNRLTAIMNRHEYSFAGQNVYDEISTVAVYYDITDPYAPKKIRVHLQDGEYVSSSLYENRLCLVTAKSISDKAQENAESVIPSFSVDGEEVKLKVEDIRIAVNDPEDSYLFVTVTDITDFTKGVGRYALLGCGDNIYCTPTAVVAAREFVPVEKDENDERSSFTEVYRLNIKGSVISFSDWYRLQGSLIGGVSVDEESGYLRVLATDSTSNHLYVLDENMEFVIGLDIFSGEKVTGVNFIGSNCYVMVDGEEEKTMIIDFSDPSSPKVAGTISEKAFSDDLYAVSETLILGISESKNINITDEETKKDERTEFVPITMTLFDVSDPTNPVTASVYTFDRNFRSVSASDSRSIMVVKEKGIFGIPVLKTDSEQGTESSAYVLFDISGGELVPLGTYTHETFYIGDAAVRGTCIEDILYTVSGEKVVAFDIGSGAPEDKKLTEFPLNKPETTDGQGTEE